MFINTPTSNILYSMNKEKVVIVISSICVITNISLNFYMINQFSFIGAGISAVVTQALMFILTTSYIYKTKKITPLKINHLSVLASGLITAIVLIYLNVSIYILIPISFIVYVVSLFVLKGLNRSHLNLAINFFRRLRS